MYPKTNTTMAWHATQQPNEGNWRHPTDGEAWEDFDSFYPTFLNDPRNVTLGFLSHGFNPF